MTRAVELAQVAALGVSEAFKNRIINGAMVIDQRNAGASLNATTFANYSIDRWCYFVNVGSKFTMQQNAGSVTPPAGFVNYLGMTSSSAYSSGAGEAFLVRQFIEGYNTADLGWGTADAKTITISFWVRSSLTGAFGGSLNNSAETRSFPFSFTINAANTWEQKSVTIPGDTTGAWLTTNATGITLQFNMGCGSSLLGTANTWQAGAKFAPTGSTSIIATSGATFYITGVQLEVGSSATGFEYVNYQTSLANCQRYCFVLRTDALGYTQYGRFPAAFVTSSTACSTSIFLPQPMRSTAYSLTYNNKQYSEYYMTGGGATGSTITLNTDANGLNWVTLNFAFIGTALPTTQGVVAGIRFTNVTDGALIISTEL